MFTYSDGSEILKGDVIELHDDRGLNETILISKIDLGELQGYKLAFIQDKENIFFFEGKLTIKLGIPNSRVIKNKSLMTGNYFWAYIPVEI